MLNTSQRLVNKNSLTWWYVFKTSWRCLQDVFARRLEDVLKTSWRRLEDVLKTFLQDVLKTSWQDVLKMSWRRLENVLKTSWRRFCKTSWRHLGKTSWRRLENVLKTYSQDEYIGLDQNVLKTSSEDVWLIIFIKMSSRRFHQDEFLLGDSKPTKCLTGHKDPNSLVRWLPETYKGKDLECKD